MQPQVSVIMPTYNRRDFICEAIQSVLTQRHQSLELIIVDDGSTDNTKEYIEESYSDTRIRYFYQENQGQSAARNFGLSIAKGDYICFLDSDNRWLPKKLAKSLELFDEISEIDVVYADTITIDEKGDIISEENMTRYSGIISDQLLKDNCVSINTLMAKRHCFEEMGGFDESLRVAEDYELWLRFSTKYKFQYIPEFFAEYRIMKVHVSSDKDRVFEINERIIFNFLDIYGDTLTGREISTGLNAFYTRKGRYFVSERRWKIGAASFFQALLRKPLSIHTWRAILRFFIQVLSSFGTERKIAH